MPRRERFPEPWVPSVIVCDEKHQRQFYPAVTRAQAYEQALLLLEGRMRGGDCYNRLEDYPEPAQPSLTKEQALGLPEGPVRKAALAERQEYLGKVAQRREIAEETTERERIISEQNGSDALDFLIATGDGHERVRLEPMKPLTREDAESGLSPY